MNFNQNGQINEITTAQQFYNPNAGLFPPGYQTPDAEPGPHTDLIYPNHPPLILAEPLEKLSLDEIVTTLVGCDEKFCEDFEYIFMEGIERILHIKWPQLEMDLVRCRDENRPEHECAPLMEEVLERASPIFMDMVNQKRFKISKDPLANYSGLQYMHPFWFDGVGEIWRRVAHGSRRYSVKDCKDLLLKSEQCLSQYDSLDNNNGAKGECLRQFSEASACESGTICPYLRIPLLVCMTRTNYDEPTEKQFKQVQKCYDELPNYKKCKVQYIPLTSETYEALGLDALSV